MNGSELELVLHSFPEQHKFQCGGFVSKAVVEILAIALHNSLNSACQNKTGMNKNASFSTDMENRKIHHMAKMFVDT